jgi:hypothetical protein
MTRVRCNGSIQVFSGKIGTSSSTPRRIYIWWMDAWMAFFLYQTVREDRAGNVSSTASTGHVIGDHRTRHALQTCSKEYVNMKFVALLFAIVLFVLFMMGLNEIGFGPLTLLLLIPAALLMGFLFQNPDQNPDN